LQKKKMIAHCGIDCGASPAYIATKKNDDAPRVVTASPLGKGTAVGYNNGSCLRFTRY
jgi:hypothetical protein